VLHTCWDVDGHPGLHLEGSIAQGHRAGASQDVEQLGRAVVGVLGDGRAGQHQQLGHGRLAEAGRGGGVQQDPGARLALRDDVDRLRFSLHHDPGRGAGRGTEEHQRQHEVQHREARIEGR